jgi:hypothetical protein
VAAAMCVSESWTTRTARFCQLDVESCRRGGHDERSPEHVRVDMFETGPFADRLDPSMRRPAVETLPIVAQQDRALAPFADREIHGAGRAWHERDDGRLAACGEDPAPGGTDGPVGLWDHTFVAIVLSRECPFLSPPRLSHVPGRGHVCRAAVPLDRVLSSGSWSAWSWCRSPSQIWTLTGSTTEASRLLTWPDLGSHTRVVRIDSR